MNIKFLEVLYYVTSIIVSLGILYSFFKKIGVSIGYEIIFLNVFQRKIYKLYFLIKRTIWLAIAIYMIIIFVNVYKGEVYKGICIATIDFIIYILCFYCWGYLDFSEFSDFPKFNTLNDLCDIFDFHKIKNCYNFKEFFHFIYQKISKMICSTQFKESILFLQKKGIFLLKVGICLMATCFSYILLKMFEYKFVIFQVLILIGSFSELKNNAIQKFKIFFTNNINKCAYIKISSPYIYCEFYHVFLFEIACFLWK